MTKTVVITGGGQGTGQAIAYRFAKGGANVVVISKDRPEQMRETEEGIRAEGGKPLIREADVRDLLAIRTIVNEAAEKFGGIDVLVNNTSAPCFGDTFETSDEQFDLVWSTSARAAFFLSKECFPWLKRSGNGHVINIAPPLNLDVQWLRDHLPFSLGKFGMSMCVKGMAAEFQVGHVAVSALWPETNIATQRLKDYLAPVVYAGSRWPTLMADATFEIAKMKCQDATGRFFLDEEVMRDAGVSDFSHYAVDPKQPLVRAIFLQPKKGMIPLSKEMFHSKR